MIRKAITRRTRKAQHSINMLALGEFAWIKLRRPQDLTECPLLIVGCRKADGLLPANTGRAVVLVEVSAKGQDRSPRLAPMAGRDSDVDFTAANRRWREPVRSARTR